MVAGLGRTVAATSHHAGLGRLRERTLLLGAQVIAIDNIGTLEIVRGRRSWILLVLGLLIVAGSATQINSIYQVIAAGGVGLGFLLIVINLMQRIERGLAIGACDGRGALIVSRDEIFLQRLLTLLTDRINTRNIALLATFDIATGRIKTEAAPAPGPFDTHPEREPPQPASAAPHANGLDGDHAPAVAAPVARAEDVPAAAVTTDPADDGAATLFGDGESATPPPTVAASAESDVAMLAAARVQPALAPAPRRLAPDPLLDIASRAPVADDDWLSRPQPETRMAPQSEGGAGRALLALLLIVVLGAIVFAAWYFTGQTGSPGAVSLIAASESPRAPAPEIRGVSDMGAPAAETSDAGVTDGFAPDVTLSPETVTAAEEAQPAPETPAEVAPFTPQAPLVARASGLAYRARPALDGDLLAETRTGGEALAVNGRIAQADGDWYRLTLLDGRTAWFKASQAIERARLAETVRPRAEDPGQPFAASVPRILEPAEGVQIGGGPQTVLLAWSSRGDAARHVVEIESYDALAQRWISEPQHRRVTVEDASELAEAFGSAGYWRWRVRSVSEAGEQSQFSRWAAFGIRN